MRRLTILQVIHGYPPLYNAGSEVYTQSLSLELAQRGHRVVVFTREEDPLRPDFEVRTERDGLNRDIEVFLVNNATAKDRYRQTGIDKVFEAILDRVRPDIVHINHLNHLSTGIVDVAYRKGYPMVYTLHDFWLMCPRGQFIKMQPGPKDVRPVCEGQEDRKCAVNCYARYFSGAPHELEEDIDYWTGWVRRRMQDVRGVSEKIDRFVAPSRQLYQRYQRDFFHSTEKLEFLDYGFLKDRFSGRVRTRREGMVFGYIGTHIVAKGVHLLIKAFSRVKGKARLVIYGKERGEITPYLKKLVHRLPDDVKSRIQWKPEYENHLIVKNVFNHVDAIVVPSIWVENSPLVIHEAQQAKIPVITADVGGMAEFVKHEENGLLFRHRDVVSLAEQMQRLVDNPDFAERLGNRGYLYSSNGDVPSMREHVDRIVEIYNQVAEERKDTRKDSPWRVTFDTNPDTCNLHCIMCEEHALESPKYQKRRTGHQTPRFMDFSLIENVVKDLSAGRLTEIIPSTMGEPLLYKDFNKIIELCKQHKVKLNLTTNGTFPGIGALEWAKALMPVLSDVKISWNGASPQTQEYIMRGSDYGRALNNLRTFIRIRNDHEIAGGNRVSVTLQLTFMKSNVAEILDIIRLACAEGVDRVKGHHLWVNHPSLQQESLKASAQSIREWNSLIDEFIKEVKRCSEKRNRPLILDNFYKLQPSLADRIPKDWECPFLGQEAWIDTSGEFHPCCAPDDLRRKLGYFGNVKESSLLDIWNSREYRNLVNNYKKHGVCQRCNMRRPKEEQHGLQ